MKRIAERGFTLVEIMIVVAIIALLAAIAIPNVLRGRTTANETASIGNMRALVSALEMQRAVNGTYPLTAAWVATMYPGGGVPAFGPPSFNAAMTPLGTPTVQSYKYLYAAIAPGSQYTVQSTPVVFNSTGTRAFFVDESGQVRHCSTGAQDKLATVASVTIDVPGVPAACP